MFDRYEEIYDSYEEERKANDSDVISGRSPLSSMPKAAATARPATSGWTVSPQAVPATTT